MDTRGMLDPVPLGCCFDYGLFGLVKKRELNTTKRFELNIGLVIMPIALLLLILCSTFGIFNLF